MDQLRSNIVLAAVPSPHEGTSYNPPVTAHQELLSTAHKAEEERLKDAYELEATKAKMEAARTLAGAEAQVGTVEGVAPGMKVAEIVEDTEPHGETEPLPPKKMPGRKTKQQRKKAERLRAEVCLDAISLVPA